MPKRDLEQRLSELEKLAAKQAHIIEQQAKRIAEQDSLIEHLQDANRRHRSAMLFSGGLVDGMKKLLSTDRPSSRSKG